MNTEALTRYVKVDSAFSTRTSV